MFNQTHQQGQHGRVNGAGPGGRGIGMNVHGIHNYQHQNTHQQYSQHHTNIQQEHTAHANNGTILAHHTTFSSGLLSSTTPNFTPSSLQNGHSGTTRGGQSQQINEHWAKQLELHKESERAHALMAEGQTHHYARAKATENRGLLPPANSGNADGQDDDKDVLRMSDQSASQRRQAWHSMDLSGQGLRVLAKPLFTYDFLKELYVASNKLTALPASISKLRFLEYLDASNNQLSDLPPELGICVFLRTLLVFDNRIHTLPNEIGFLFKLEMFGIEGNPLDPALKEVIMEKGTKELIEQLLESAPGMKYPLIPVSPFSNLPRSYAAQSSRNPHTSRQRSPEPREIQSVFVQYPF
jgi:CCR4-NOT transcription complex subunit 6